MSAAEQTDRLYLLRAGDERAAVRYEDCVLLYMHVCLCVHATGVCMFVSNEK